METALFCAITQGVVVIPYLHLVAGFPETSVRNYHYSLRNSAEEGSFLLTFSTPRLFWAMKIQHKRLYRIVRHCVILYCLTDASVQVVRHCVSLYRLTDARVQTVRHCVSLYSLTDARCRWSDIVSVYTVWQMRVCRRSDIVSVYTVWQVRVCRRSDIVSVYTVWEMPVCRRSEHLQLSSTVPSPSAVSLTTQNSLITCVFLWQIL
jgi:hypothetical protein